MASARKFVLIGAGGHAKVILDIVKSDPSLDLVGCTAKPPEHVISSVPVLGDDSVLPSLYEQGVRHAFVAVGDNGLRERLARQVVQLGFELINAVSPRAYIADSVRLGTGIAVMPGCVINAEAEIMDFAIINTSASVDHECVIGAACHIAPGATLSGRVTIGTGAWIGTGAKVIDGISIGEWSILGAGSVAIRDIPDWCTAVGVPARVIKRRS